MRLFAWVPLWFLAFTKTAVAEPVVLKSGARGELQTSVSTALEKYGGSDAGNMVQLTIGLDPKIRPNSSVDARSLCVLWGQSEYTRLQNDADFRSAAQNWFDLDAPLDAVRVSFKLDGDAGRGVGVALNRDFDMRGIVKCRPFG